MSDLLNILGIASGGASAIPEFFATEHQNKKSREFSREMYERQRADNIEFWRMQNEYNTPTAQRARLTDAGLNPALMFGQGASAGNAGGLSAPSAMPAQFRVPDLSMNPLASINSIADLEVKQAQTDNLKSQNTVIIQEALHKAAQTAKTLKDTDFTDFKLGFEKSLESVSADARKEALRQLQQQIQLNANRDAREAASNAMSVQEAAERMLSMQKTRLLQDEQIATSQTERNRIRQDIARIQQSMESVGKDIQLKQLDINLRKQGINPNDPMWSRIIGQFLSRIIDEEGNYKGPSFSIPRPRWR